MPFLRAAARAHYQEKAGFTVKNDIPFSEILPLMDKSFHTSSNCSGCGI